jgi:DNA-binding response OmpR family regulator
MRRFEVHEAGCLAEAHGALSVRFDWVLLDLMLPDGNGMELLRRIKSQRLAAKVCVISGCCTELFDEARATGAHETLVKPIDVDYLLQMLGADVTDE